MSFAITKSEVNHTEFRKNIREFVNLHIRHNAEKIDETGDFPWENLKALADKGYNSLLIPEEYDGLGLDHVSFAIAVEEIGRACASTSLIYVMHVGAAQTIVTYGTEDQKDRWLKPIRDGIIGTHSTSEKATGGHTWFNLSEAERKGEDYLLNLEKSFTTSGGQADFYVLQTKTPGAQKPSDLSFFIVDGHHKGIRAGAWNALGVRGNHSGPLYLKDVEVKRQDLLWAENKGVEIVLNGVDPLYLLGMGSAWLGVAEEIYDQTVAHVQKTIHRDFNKGLRDYQVLRHQLAEAKLLIQSLKPWHIDLAKKFDETIEKKGQLGDLWYKATEFKIYCTEVANKIAQISLDITGGYGYTKGIFERLYRDVRAGKALAPSNHLARELIAKDIVGLPTELWSEGGE